MSLVLNSNGGTAVSEVGVRVKLTNGADEELCRLRQLAPDQVRAGETDAMVDTGAVRTVIPARLAQKLGLSMRGERTVEFADGRKSTLAVTGPVIVEIMGRDAVEDALVTGDEVLIGQTVLEKLDLLVDCAKGRLVPNPAHPDQPVTKLK